jgi:hypothetical protein
LTLKQESLFPGLKLERTPANRLGLDYRQPPPRRWQGPIIDVHTHVRNGATTPLFLEVADTYGVAKILSMTPLANADGVRAAAGGRIDFIAIPNWGNDKATTERFIAEWLDNLNIFRAQFGAKLCKFWMAPMMRERRGITMQHPLIQPVIDRAIELGYDFMTHVGDPSVWWGDGKKYADTEKFGTKSDQYPQLRHLCERVYPRRVISAHMGGWVEEPAFLSELLDTYINLHLDCSATKWIVRETARKPDAVRELFLRHPTRILFGSDIVTGDTYDFDHYASRYWAHQMMWETEYRGESPIEDPDAENPPRLAGLDLPIEVLEQLYHGNAARLGLV